MPFVTDVKIEITRDPSTNQYVAAVDKDRPSAKRGGFVRWRLKRLDAFPSNAEVIIQFVGDPAAKNPVDGPFVDGADTHGRYTTTGDNIVEPILFAPNGGYNYVISYDDNGVERPLLDPEIVVDGNASLIIKFLKAVQTERKLLKVTTGGKTRKTAARQSSKGVRRSPKRKAKKR